MFPQATEFPQNPKPSADMQALDAGNCLTLNGKCQGPSIALHIHIMVHEKRMYSILAIKEDEKEPRANPPPNRPSPVSRLFHAGCTSS